MDNESVLKKIEELMLQRGYTRYMLAKVSGISKSTITTIFNRRSTMSLYNLSKVCRAFDLTLSEFFSMLEGKTENGLLQDFPLDWWSSLPPEKRRQVTTIMRVVAELDLRGK
ncbi:MAG: helix-turn-helix transcriptional regulator [Hungatella sp.]|nr:helix-turn-helix transcriptional regulator [Hungatella sp.]